MFTLYFCLTFGFHPILNKFQIFHYLPNISVCCPSFFAVQNPCYFFIICLCGNLVPFEYCLGGGIDGGLKFDDIYYKDEDEGNFCFMSGVSQREGGGRVVVVKPLLKHTYSKNTQKEEHSLQTGAWTVLKWLSVRHFVVVLWTDALDRKFWLKL